MGRFGSRPHRVSSRAQARDPANKARVTQASLNRQSSDCEVPHPNAFGFGMTDVARGARRGERRRTIFLRENRGNLKGGSSGSLDPFDFAQGWLSLGMTGYKVITQYAVARKTKRRTGYSHDRDAGGYKP
jgi:hypothetical protein